MAWSSGWSNTGSSGGGSSSGGEVDLTDYYTKKQTNSLISAIDLKIIDLSKLYTNAQIDTLLTNLKNGSYTKQEVDDLLQNISTGNVDLSEYYTKQKVDELLSGISTGEVDLSSYETKTNVTNLFKGYYTRLEIDELLTGLSVGGSSGETPTVDLSKYYTSIQTDTKYTTKDELGLQHQLIVAEISRLEKLIQDLDSGDFGSILPSMFISDNTTTTSKAWSSTKTKGYIDNSYNQLILNAIKPEIIELEYGINSGAWKSVFSLNKLKQQYNKTIVHSTFTIKNISSTDTVQLRAVSNGIDLINVIIEPTDFQRYALGLSDMSTEIFTIGTGTVHLVLEVY